MKVFYDHQIFQHQQYGGISRYYAELMLNMKNRSDVSYMLPIVDSSNHYLKSIPEISHRIKGSSDYYKEFLFGLEFPGKWRLFKQRNKWFPGALQRNRRHSEMSLNQASYDLFHPTDIDDYFLPFIKDRPFVITIHDMIDEYFPEYAFHVHSTYRTSVKKKLVERAAGVIAVSESTKHDLMERFAVAESKIKVIYHGPSDLQVNEGAPIVSGAYFLYVGKRVHYKNFYFFVQSVQLLLEKNPSVRIVCAGAPFNADELAYFADLGIEQSVVGIQADDEQLSNLYRHARALVYPSLYEGFGMPVLEALQCSCPVMVSNTSSLPEVGGDAVLYFNPKEIESIRYSFEAMLYNDTLRNELIAKGHQQLRKFSWSKAAELTFDFYKSII